MKRKTKNSAVDDNPAPTDEGVSADSVADFLRRNPDFFNDRLDLLSEMAAPSRWTGDGIVDMQLFLAERRLGEIDDLRNCAQEVIETSRTNMSVQTRTHASVLALLAVGDLDQLLRVVSDDLPLLLDVDVVTLGFEPSAGPVPVAAVFSTAAHRIGKGAVDELLGADNNVRLLREIKDDGTIFGSASGLVRSAALARLRPGPEIPAGFMALGSRGAAFGPGQGTELIGFLARVMEACIFRLVEHES